MPKIIITNLPPYTGSYDVDLNFTNRDFHTIKQISGLRPAELEDAMEAGDNDLIVALAVCALHRAGHVVKGAELDRIWDAPVGRITYDDAVEADAVPPPQPNDENTSALNESIASSGMDGRSDGDYRPESDPNGTGSQLSETDAVSGLMTSQT